MSEAQPTAARCCGTCRHHQGEEIAGFRQCAWPRPALPFWAFIDDVPDHADWTAERDGRRCPTWIEREEAANAE